MSILKKIFGKRKPAAAIGTEGELSAVEAVEKKVRKEVEVKKTESKEAVRPFAKTRKVDAREDETILDYLSKPLISEKATDLTQFNQYCFIVKKTANKSEVSKKIVNLYGVKPIAVNFIRMSGKKVRFGRRFGWKKDVKKAIVFLAPGDKIELYEGV